MFSVYKINKIFLYYQIYFNKYLINYICFTTYIFINIAIYYSQSVIAIQMRSY